MSHARTGVRGRALPVTLRVPRRMAAGLRTALALTVMAVLGGCFWRGSGPSVAPGIPMLSAERADIEQRVADLQRQLEGRALSGSRRRAAEEELQTLQARLTAGDLRVGDQLVITMLGDSAVRVDTATVRDGMVVSFAGLPDADVGGLVQAEIRGRLQAHTDRFFKNRTLRVSVPTRIAVLGEIRTPGFYSIPADRPIAELIMLAGGPTPLTDLNKVSVRRNGDRILSASAWDRAQKAGMTVGELGLRGGDEIEIGRRRQINWAQISQQALLAVAGTAAFLQVLILIYGTE